MSPEPVLDEAPGVEAPAAAPSGAVAGAPRATVVVYDRRGQVGPVVRAAVAGLDPAPEVRQCSTPRQLGQLLDDGRTDLLVAGPGLDTPAGFERLRIIREELPRLPVVLALSGDAAVDARDAVRAGALDVIADPGDAALVEAVVERALAVGRRLGDDDGAPAPTRTRRVVAVTSASGGSGKTTLATNLGWFLHHRAGRRVCVIDLDLQFGEVASTLGLHPGHTVADLVAQAGGTRADLATHIEGYCTPHGPGLSVLAAPRDIREAAALSTEDVGRVVDAARARFDEVVIDTPPSLAEPIAAALGRADELVVVATPDVPSARNLHALVTALDGLDRVGETIHLVLNKAERGAAIDARQLRKVFPQGVAASLPYAREVRQALDTGTPVLAQSPEAPVSVALDGLLRTFLPGDAPVPVPGAEPRPGSPGRRPWRARRRGPATWA